jgi:lipopolysaccharide/colanic/teichoic acid biosynthesis glycosyltransferase
MKRLIDIVFTLALLIMFFPIMMVATVGIMINSRGPILYRATRIGKGGESFTMFKFRSMHVSSQKTSEPLITVHGDKRIFQFGKILRKTKADELPQLLNVLLGNMSLVGPRPEDPKIVETYYTDWMKYTLTACPGITSPGAIFYYGVGEKLIKKDDPEGSYATILLPPKMAIERAYLERATWLSDLVCIVHTALAILGALTNRPVPPLSRDRKAALKWVRNSAFLQTPKA